MHIALFFNLLKNPGDHLIQCVKTSLIFAFSICRVFQGSHRADQETSLFIDTSQLTNERGMTGGNTLICNLR